LHIRIFVLVVFWVWEILGVLSESERAVWKWTKTENQKRTGSKGVWGVFEVNRVLIDRVFQGLLEYSILLFFFFLRG
jgi:hypothetical protein